VRASNFLCEPVRETYSRSSPIAIPVCVRLVWSPLGVSVPVSLEGSFEPAEVLVSALSGGPISSTSSVDANFANPKSSILHWTLLRQENICRLDVAMNDAFVMSSLQPVADLNRNL